MTTKAIGWVCNECGGLNKHLDLDREFGKKRKKLDCDNCGEEQLPREEQTQVYTEKEIIKTLRRDLAMFESEKTQAANELAEAKLNGRLSQIKGLAKLLGLRSELESGEGVSICLYCGVLNNEDAPRCEKCGRSDFNEFTEEVVDER